MSKKDDDKANMSVFNAILAKAINTAPIKAQKSTNKKKQKPKLNKEHYFDTNIKL